MQPENESAMAFVENESWDAIKINCINRKVMAEALLSEVKNWIHKHFLFINSTENVFTFPRLQLGIKDFKLMFKEAE